MAGTPLVKVLDKGKDLVADPNCQIISVDIMKEVNSIPRARLVLSDGDSAKQKFDLSNEASFEPGKEIEIQLGYMGEPDKAVTVFKGIVIKHGVKADKNTSSLIVDLRDKAIRLTTKRKNVVFRNKKDSDILKEILKKWNPEIENTLFKHREMVQYYCTDWDFVLSRADLNGHWVLADDGSMTIKRHLIKNLGKKKPDCRVEYGKSPIYDFEMEADIRGLYKSVQSKGWDIKEQKLSESPKKKSKTLVQGNLKPDQMAEVLGSGMYHLVDAIDLDKKELEVWADSKMRKSCLSMLKGRVRIPGDANIKPGGVIEVKGVGDRFNGKTYV
ncbi:MAG: phage late control D family protein, partial [Deltaproteobacteria bacterium]|nr:phage late control D family protein [Deltaproteobacteria bacterium]